MADPIVVGALVFAGRLVTELRVVVLRLPSVSVPAADRSAPAAPACFAGLVLVVETVGLQRLRVIVVFGAGVPREY